MTAATTARLDEAGPLVPARGTITSAANQLHVKNCIVVRNASGLGVVPTDGDGFDAIGVSQATYDYRTGSEAVTSGDPLDVELHYGVWAFELSGDSPLPGEMTYVVDNQTVSRDSNGGVRGKAGPCTEVRDGMVYVWVGPHVSALTKPGARVLSIPLNSFRIASSGAAVAAFAAGTTDGFDSTAESGGIRWNDDSTVAFATNVVLFDVDDASPIVIHALGYRVGSADPTAALDFTVFFQSLGAAFSADADAGGDSSAFAAATTVLSEGTRTIAAADIPAGPCVMHMTVVPTAALDDDDFVLTGLYLTYTPK